MSQSGTEPVLHHHERLDGSGYTDGIAGEQITLPSRIVAVADVIDANSADRPYRASLGLGAAIEELTTKRAKLYDSDVVDAALWVIRST
jgi:HD-GYP domain-containing protein (c-di-GMP phosphodiesterase class II)